MTNAQILTLSALELAQAIRNQEVTSEQAVSAVLENIDRCEYELHAYISIWQEELLAKARACDAKIRAEHEKHDTCAGSNGSNGSNGSDTGSANALNQATAEDARSDGLPPLLGVPIAVKDNLVTAGHQTSCGSRMLAGYQPPYTATCVAKLEAAGAIIIGKTNMDEFGMGISTETSYFGATVNPFDTERVPGGSSGGSAAAVAAYEAFAALGTDTGGSIRQPAAFCGLVGLRPTYGTVSRHGLVAFASSMDVAGPITRTTRDAAGIFNIVTGADERDQTSVSAPKIDLAAMERYDIRGKRIGIPKQLLPGVYEAAESDASGEAETSKSGAVETDALAPEVQHAFAKVRDYLTEAGAVVEDMDIPILDYAVAIYYILSSAEASSNLSRYDGIRYGYRASDVENLGELFTKTRSEGFGMEVKRRILLGNYVLSSEHFEDCYRKAERARAMLTQSLVKALDRFDFLLCPTSPVLAPKIGANTDDPLTAYLSDLCTVPASLAGLPAISIPAAWAEAAEADAEADPLTQHLPVGIQFIGRKFGEQEILGAARYLEKHFREDGVKQATPPDEEVRA